MSGATLTKNHIIQSAYLSLQNNCRVYLKPEWYGPTLSHKDKWAKIAIQIALDKGARKIVLMSSGNQGLAAAAQAFANKVECMIVCPASIHPVYLRLFKQYNAKVSFAKNEESLSPLFEEYIRSGYFPLGITHEQRQEGEQMPGIEGYKISAMEIVEGLGFVPDILVFPTAYSDHPQGVLRGFEDMLKDRKIETIPQFILARAREPEGDLATSISTNRTTPYVTDILRKTNGKSVFLNNEEMLTAQKLCLQIHGWKIEISSAAAIACLKKLPIEIIETKSLVLILTALEKN